MEVIFPYITYFWNQLVQNAPYLVGFALPPFVEFLNKDIQQSYMRFGVAAIACLLVAIVLHWSDISYGTPEQAFQFATIIFFESESVYRLYFKNSWLRQTIRGGNTEVEVAEVQSPAVE